MFGWGFGADQQQQKQAEGGTKITLHVYDLGPGFAGANAVGKAIGTGAFHAGVEVYGAEWSFCCAQDGPYRSGIFKVPPRGCCAHVYREAIDMGRTSMSAREVRTLIERLYKEWPGADYDLLRKNCCHFSDTLCIELGVGPIPGWVSSLAGVGAALRSGARIAVQGVAALPGGVADVGAAAPGFIWAGVGAVGGFLGEVGNAVGGAFAGGPENEGATTGGYPPPPSASGQPSKPRPLIVPSHPELRERAAAEARKSSGSCPWSDGDLVEVWSNSSRSWCPGKIESATSDGNVLVTFQISGGSMASKTLPWNHDHLRAARKSVGGGAAEAADAQAAGPLGKGDFVEVFSNSQQAWCPGYVEGKDGQMLNVVFKLPGAPMDQKSHKQVPADHKDVRRAIGTAVAQCQALKGGKPSRESGSAVQQVRSGPGAEAATAEMWVAVKRASRAVQVEDACSLAEAQGVPAAELEAARTVGVHLAHKDEVAESRRSTDANWIDQACKRALDAGVPSEDLAAARSDARRLYAIADVTSAAKLGDDEVLSEAVALALAAGVPAQEIEKAKREAIAARARAAATIPPPGMGVPLGSAVLMQNVGDWVEVYSRSHDAWCTGRITKRTAEGPRVLFQLPGAKSDDWLEKVVPNGSNQLRRPASVIAAAANKDIASPVGVKGGGSLDDGLQETAACSAKFRELSGGAAGSRLDTKKMTEFLRASGLPRKVLKQIWLATSQPGQQDFGEEDFFGALRLVGHCQAILASGDAGSAELIAEGGDALKDLMETEWKHRPPQMLARFHGHLLEAPSPARRR